MKPFDFINAINTSKKDLFLEDPLVAKKAYSPWVVNLGLSFYHDTIFHVNEMNRLHHLEKENQFQYLLNSIPKGKRWSAWHKKDKNSDDLDLVMEYYGYSIEKAKGALKVLSSDQLKVIKEKLYKGGK
jgi:NACalpha-BTF3-like transcription factor